MKQTSIFPLSALIAGIALCLIGAQIGDAQRRRSSAPIFSRQIWLNSATSKCMFGSPISRRVRRPAVTLIRRRGSSTCWKAPSSWKWVAIRRKRSRQVRPSWNPPTRSTTSGMRARPSLPRLWVSNMPEKGSRCRSTRSSPLSFSSTAKVYFTSASASAALSASADAVGRLSVSVNAAVVEPARLLPVGRNPLGS